MRQDVACILAWLWRDAANLENMLSNNIRVPFHRRGPEDVEISQRDMFLCEVSVSSGPLR